MLKLTGVDMPDGLEKIKNSTRSSRKELKNKTRLLIWKATLLIHLKVSWVVDRFQDSPEFGKKIREQIYDKAKGPGKGEEMVEALKSPGAKKSYEF